MIAPAGTPLRHQRIPHRALLSYSATWLSPLTSTCRTFPAAYTAAAVSIRPSKYKFPRPSGTTGGVPRTSATSRSGTSVTVAYTRPTVAPATHRSHAITPASKPAPTTPTIINTPLQ